MEENPRYRLDELGWSQFERLVDALVAEEGIVPAWEGRADVGRTAVLDDGRALAVVWVRPSVRERLTRESLLAQLAQTLRESANGRPLRLFTNLGLAVDEAASLSGGGEYVGPHELSAAVDARPTLRRRVPSLLGICDLDELVPTDARGASTADYGAMRELARVFVPTGAYERAVATAARHHFAVLTGPPEMGKTAIARTLGLALLAEGWEVHECTRPDELWSSFARERAQLFIADDAFGSTEYRPEAGERWAVDLDLILRRLDERHWLVWTSRPTPLKAALRRIHREHGGEHWPRPAAVHVAADRLDVEEKAAMLLRHAQAAGLPAASRGIVQRHGWQIVAHEHFTPERIRRFVGGSLRDLADAADQRLVDVIAAEIREPTAAMAASLAALPPEHRALLVALLDVPPGPAAERDLAAATRRHSEGGIPRPASELVDRLTDHFLRVVPPASVVWVHPSWRDLVIDDVASDAAARRAFLSRCAIDGALLALSRGGGAAGERALPFLRDDADWDSFAGRLHVLLVELTEEDAARALAALDDALASAPPERAAQELRAIALEALAVVARRWSAGRASFAPELLSHWLRLRESVPDPPPLPDLEAAWRKVEPVVAPSLASTSELLRFDEWLRLVDVLGTHAPEVPARLGFPHAYAEEITLFVRRAHRLVEEDERAPTAGLVADVLRRIDRVAPGLGARTVSNLLTENVGVMEWDVTTPAADDRETTREIVRRILGDL